MQMKQGLLANMSSERVRGGGYNKKRSDPFLMYLLLWQELETPQRFGNIPPGSDVCPIATLLWEIETSRLFYVMVG